MPPPLVGPSWLPHPLLGKDSGSGLRTVDPEALRGGCLLSGGQSPSLGGCQRVLGAGAGMWCKLLSVPGGKGFTEHCGLHCLSGSPGTPNTAYELGFVGLQAAVPSSGFCGARSPPADEACSYRAPSRPGGAQREPHGWPEPPGPLSASRPPAGGVAFPTVCSPPLLHPLGSLLIPASPLEMLLCPRFQMCSCAACKVGF